MAKPNHVARIGQRVLGKSFKNVMKHGSRASSRGKQLVGSTLDRVIYGKRRR